MKISRFQSRQFTGVAFILFASLLASGCASTFDGLKTDIRQMMGKEESADSESGEMTRPVAESGLSARESMITDIQQQLSKLGYNPGRSTGKLNARTEAAIQDFQLDNNLRIDGKPSAELLELLNKKAATI